MTVSAASTAYPPPRKAWTSAVVIFVLTAIALADRMAISMLIGPIKAEFGIGDFQASLLIGFAFTLFEIFVSFLQAFIFTLLAAVYIQMSLDDEH